MVPLALWPSVKLKLLNDSSAGGVGAGLKLGVCNSLQLCKQLGLQVQPFEEIVVVMTPM